MNRNTLLATALALTFVFFAMTSFGPQHRPGDPDPVPTLPTGDPAPPTKAPYMPPGRTFSEHPAR